MDGRPPIVALDRVDCALGGAPVLCGVSLEVREGEGWAILGPNGGGKSTLLRLLRGDLWPTPATAARRLFHGRDGPQTSPIGVRDRIALVAPEAQDAYVRRDWDLRAEVVIRSGLHDQLWPQSPATPAERARVAEVAALLGVEDLLGRSILELSRGEARRVLLARALAPRPRLLLLDEACDGLDRAAREQFLELVSRIARAGTALVMATHRPEEIVPEIERVAVVREGRIERAGAREEVLREMERALAGGQTDPLPSHLAEAHTPHPDPLPSHLAEAHTPQPLSPRRRRGERGGTVPSFLPPLPPAEPGGEGRGEGGERDVLFDLSDVTVLVEGRAVLDHVTWTLRAGESWAVVGPNGAGKSTFLRLLAGEEQPARGAIRRLDLGERASAPDLHRRVAAVGPELQARHRADATGEEVVLSGFAGTIGLAEAPTPEARARAAEWIARLGLAPLARRHVHALSYGELRRLLVARALAPGPEALLLDEPLAGLDPAARAWILSTLDGVAARGTALVVVSHHEDEIPRVVRLLARLEAGRLVSTGPRTL